MVQCFAAHFGCFDKYAEILNNLVLPGKIGNLGWADIILKFFVGRTKRLFIDIQVGVSHTVNVIIGFGKPLKNSAPIICIYKYKLFIFVLLKTSESKYCQCLYFTANALARKIEKLAQASWRKVDLSPSHAYLLMMAIDEPGVQPSTLVDHLQLQPSTISRLLEKLETRKLVVRITEGKTTNVYPTQKGKDLLPRLKECLHEFYSRYASLLGKEESAKLVQSMNKFADKLIV